MDPNAELPIGEVLPPTEGAVNVPAPGIPLENPPWDGWTVLLIAIVQFVIPFLVVLPIVVVVAKKTLYPTLPFQIVGQKPWIVLCTQFVWYLAVAVFMVMFVEGKYHQGFWDAIRWNWPRRTWRLLVLLGMALVLLQLVEKLFPTPKHVPMEEFLKTPSAAILTAIFAVTLGPLMEELFFRGFFYPVLARRFGLIAAIVITSLPFALLHGMQLAFAPGLVLVILLVGVVLTIVRAKTGSVGASFVVHVAYNSTLVLLGAIDAARHGLK